MKKIGIHDLDIATTHHVVQLDDLAAHLDVDPAKFHLGLGQDAFSWPAPDEDIVTMAAAAAAPIIERHGTDGLRSIFFATESGVDQSKAAGAFVHGLLGLPSTCRVVEFKQACYGGTAALMAALGIVSRNPGEKVLIIASDVARYQLDSPGEPTQGAAAVAMLITEDPALMEVEPLSGLCTIDVDDFWRPNDSSTAVVDGHLSMRAYVDSITGAWDDLAAQGGPAIDTIDRWVYHQPFSKMARKAHAALAEHTGADLTDDMIASGLLHNRQLGNSYTGSLHAGILALLEHEDDLAGKRVACFSYGSGSVGELFTGIVTEGYRSHVNPERTKEMLAARVPLSIEDYRALHAAEVGSTDDVEIARVTPGEFRFAGVKGRARYYERAQR